MVLVVGLKARELLNWTRRNKQDDCSIFLEVEYA